MLAAHIDTSHFHAHAHAHACLCHARVLVLFEDSTKNRMIEVRRVWMMHMRGYGCGGDGCDVLNVMLALDVL